MLSLLVSNSLERIYANNTNEDPATGLISLDHYVRTGLNQDSIGSQSNDGCDAALLRIDRSRQILEFAGAKIGIFQLSPDGKVTRYSASRCSLGYIEQISQQDRPRLTKINYSHGDLFAIVTDGLTDQIGWNGNKKSAYGYRRIESLLSQNVGSNAPDVLGKLKNDFREWQGTEVRRDDVTVIVFTL